MRWVGKSATFASLLLLPCVVRAAGPIPDPIVKGNLTIGLGTLATGLTSPVDLLPSPDNPNKLFVVDQTGKVNVIQNGVLQSTPFLDYTSRLVSLIPAYDERGLLGMAFSPEYNQVGSPRISQGLRLRVRAGEYRHGDVHGPRHRREHL